MRQEVDVLLGDPFGETGELADLVEVGNAVFPKEFHPVIVMDVAVDGLFAVIGFEGDLRSKISVEIKGDNLPLVGDGAGKVVDIAAGGEHFPVLLDFTGVGTDHGVADPEKGGEVELGEQGALVEGLIDPALHSLFPEGLGVEAVGDMGDVLIGDEREDDRNGAGGSDGFAPTGNSSTGTAIQTS